MSSIPGTTRDDDTASAGEPSIEEMKQQTLEMLRQHRAAQRAAGGTDEGNDSNGAGMAPAPAAEAPWSPPPGMPWPPVGSVSEAALLPPNPPSGFNRDGTYSLRGDRKTIRDQLDKAGITMFLPIQGGLMIGTSQAQRAHDMVVGQQQRDRAAEGSGDGRESAENAMRLPEGRVTAFAPDFHADGSKPAYDFGDPLADGGNAGDVLAANGAATEIVGRPQHQSFLDDRQNDPVLNAPVPKTGVVPERVLQEAEARLRAGDRGGAYLVLYRELGNEQLATQAQITTYTGLLGAGALAGNAWAKKQSSAEYQQTLDEFSKDIVQGAINAIRADIKNKGTGRIPDDKFQEADRGVWESKNMGKYFPGNSQFADFILGKHALKEGAEATFSQGTANAIGLAARALVPDTGLLGLNRDGRNIANEVGKRPAEYAGDSNYTIHGSDNDRFITVIDNRDGSVEAFYDKHPRLGAVPLLQSPNVPLDPDSLAMYQRKNFYGYLGANMPRPGTP